MNSAEVRLMQFKLTIKGISKLCDLEPLFIEVLQLSCKVL